MSSLLGSMQATVAFLAASAFFLVAMYFTSSRRTTDALIVVAVATVSWNDLRIPGGLTVSDPLLLASAFLAGLGLGTAPIVTVRTHRALGPLSRFGIALAVGGLLGGLLVDGDATGVPAAMKFAVSLFTVLYFAAVVLSDEARWFMVVRAFVVGAAASAACSIVTDTSSGFGGRQTGLSNHPNHFGLVMLLGIFASISLAFRRSRPDRILGLLALLPLGIGLISSGSRGALAATILGLAFILISVGSRALPMIAILSLPIAALAAWVETGASSGSSAISRLLSPTRYDDVAAQDRVGLFTAALDLIRDHPLTGSGFSRALEFHNVVLQILVTGGVLGAVALVFLFTYLRRVIGAGFGRTASPLVRVMAGGVLAAFLFILLAPNFYDRFLLLFLAIAGCAPVVFRSPPAARSRPVNAVSFPHASLRFEDV